MTRTTPRFIPPPKPDIEPAEARGHGGHRTFHGSPVAHVAFEAEDPAGIATRLGQRMLSAHGPVGSGAGDRHVMPAGEEPHGQGVPNPARAAGNERNKRHELRKYPSRR